MDQAIKDKPGILYSLNVSWTGATAGDVIHIEDALSANVANDKLYTVRIDATTGRHHAVLPSVGYQAVIGLWLNLQGSGGNFAINVGYD